MRSEQHIFDCRKRATGDCQCTGRSICLHSQDNFMQRIPMMLSIQTMFNFDTAQETSLLDHIGSSMRSHRVGIMSNLDAASK